MIPWECPALGDLVDAVVDVRTAIASLQAREARLLASAADLADERAEHLRAAGRRSRADIPLRDVSAELGAAMRVSDRAVQGRISDALTLVTRFAATLRAWEDGRIDGAHVAAIIDAGAAIVDDDRRARFEEHVLRIADGESAARLRGIARAVAAELDPDGGEDHMADADARRMVRVVDRGEGIARLVADMKAPLAYGILDRLTQMAGVVQHGSGVTAVHDGSGLDQQADARTTDQLRVDILCDILLGGSPVAHGDGLAAIAARVQVTVPALTLAGRDAGPALLAGFGPIDLETARRLAGRAGGWDRVLTHPFSGAVLAVDRYRPSSAIVRFLAARDEHCRFPGCRRPAHRCDIDHTIDAARSGATAADNLAHFCRRHHTLKHETAWHVRQAGAGVLEWTSPNGRRYQDHPPSTVRFVLSRDETPWDESSRSVHGDGEPPPF